MLRPHAEFDLDPKQAPPLPVTSRVEDFHVTERTDSRLALLRSPRWGAAVGSGVLGLFCGAVAVGTVMWREAFGWPGLVLVGFPAAATTALSVNRVLARVRPTPLVVDTARREVQGVCGGVVRAALEEVRHVRLTVTIWRAENGLSATARASVGVVVGERELEGPRTAELPVTEWRAARGKLLPFAVELCRRTRRPLEVVCRGFERNDGARVLPVG
ncbi:MAG: hypothetical protein AB2A00_10145 [Myxococcota bacterium]